MYYNGNLDSHLSALLFLAAAGMVVLLLITAVVLFFQRRQWLPYALTAGAILMVGYGMLLLAFSWLSSEYTLARGEEKYLCALDCHLAYSVQQVERLKYIGDIAAHGEFYVVTLRTRFDEKTTAPWRPRDVPLVPSVNDVEIVDASGRRFLVAPIGQKVWEATHGTSKSLHDCLRPGEEYETTLVFDIPFEAAQPRLLVGSAGFPTVILIGDENSFLHRKTYFSL